MSSPAVATASQDKVIPSSDFSGSNTHSSLKSDHPSSATSLSPPEQPNIQLCSSPPPAHRTYINKRSHAALEHEIAIRRLECGAHSLPPPGAVKQAEKFLRHGLDTLSDSAIKKATSLKYASSERIRHDILATAWKIKEKERAVNFLTEVQVNNEMSLSIANAELDALKDHLNLRGLDMEKEDMGIYQAFQERNAIDFEAILAEVRQVEVYALARGVSMGGLGRGVAMQDLPPVHVPFDYDAGQLSGVDEPDSTDDDSDGNDISLEPRESSPPRSP